MKLKFILFLLLFLHMFHIHFGQTYNPVGVKFDETSLVLTNGSSVLSDVTADGGNVIYRPASSTGSTIWFGPYRQLPAGNYLVQFRMKVSANTTTSKICDLDIMSLNGNISANITSISPNNFRASNEWQLFTIPVQLSANTTEVEVRGLNFQPGITDLYLDYINIVPGDARGFYSNEYTVSPKGQVSIGSRFVSDTYKLSVNGPSIFTKIVVKNFDKWPDYVFDSTYKIPCLKSVEQYINQNKHLPDVLSAKEVQENGIDLADNQAVLLKKIEELTLYLIEQDKRLKQIEAKLK